MPRFQFRALDSRGETVEGELEAADQPAAIGVLRERQQMPLDIQLAGTPLRGGGRSKLADWLNQPLWGRSALSQKDLAVMTRELSTLIGAGLTLDRSLTFLADVAGNDVQRRLVEDILNEVRSGRTLADALEARGGIFSKTYVSLIRAGEAGNALDDVLARLAGFLDQSEQLRRQVTTALVYPAILMTMALASIMVLLTLVLPQFTPLFDDAGADLPLLTQAVVAGGDVAAAYWWLILLAGIAAPIALKAWARDPDNRARLDGLLLKLPLIGDLIVKVETARLVRTAGTLLVNGVTLTVALAITGDTIRNAVLRDLVGETLDAVKQGKGLATTLERSGALPRLATEMIAVGEQSGQLDAMMLKTAAIFDQEVKTTVERLMTLLVPALTIGVGLIVAAIIGAILSAILATYQLPI